MCSTEYSAGGGTVGRERGAEGGVGAPGPRGGGVVLGRGAQMIRRHLVLVGDPDAEERQLAIVERSDTGRGRIVEHIPPMAGCTCFGCWLLRDDGREATLADLPRWPS